MKGNLRLKSTFQFAPRSLTLPVVIVLILILLLIIFAWPDPASGQAGLPMVAAPSPTPTEVPGIYNETTEQTAGIIIGAAVLVLIIVGGTIGVLRRKNGNVTDKR